ncbi:response regulator [Cognatiyoonia sp. IB215446]|uniref:response regulator n=1 Tax=Cognatiyoonia sp. IB215446 TaxID=3097355 RepID=UPI002A148DEC|nr:response regulator [Cognatiyoonia sp. IB215446]MDX8347575.1 response regulator [Cognatiyoonia sp. IB215446]
MDALTGLIGARAPTAHRPLLGITVLVVEDSRYASEAMRLMCLRSGARIRRADSLQTARRHLAVYRPTVVLVDVGLPDGSGLALIEALAQATPRIEVILGISGETTAEEDVHAAGADGFIAKPIDNLSAFQHAILTHLPADRQPPGPRLINDEVIRPDSVAYHDDLNHIAQVLRDEDQDNIDYVTQFLGGVARSANDEDLDRAVRDLVAQKSKGGNLKPGVAALSEMVQTRIAAAGPL